MFTVISLYQYVFHLDREKNRLHNHFLSQQSTSIHDKRTVHETFTNVFVRIQAS